eukprot:3717131-Rhodomonas_salina.9
MIASGSAPSDVTEHGRRRAPVSQPGARPRVKPPPPPLGAHSGSHRAFEPQSQPGTVIQVLSQQSFECSPAASSDR